MAVIKIPEALKEKLAEEGSEALIEVLNQLQEDTQVKGDGYNGGEVLAEAYRGDE